MHRSIKINGVEYWLKNQIGQGTFSKVYEAVNQHNQQVAIKEVDKRQFQFEELIAQTRMEIDILNTIQHPKNPNIIEFIGSQETEYFFYMIFEFCPISLEQCSSLFRDFIGENVAKRLMNQVVNGVKALHSNKIIHRNLKLENIMLQTDKQRWDQVANNKQHTQQDIAEFFSNVTLKLINFGVSKAITTDELSLTFGVQYYIMAPEIRMNQPYNEKVDIYSLGVIYYQLLTGQLPFKPTLESSSDKQEPLIFGENLILSTQTKQLLRKMLQFQPEHRPTLDELHEWFKLNRYNQPINIDNPRVNWENIQTPKFRSQMMVSPEKASPKIYKKDSLGIGVEEEKMYLSIQNEIYQEHNIVTDSTTYIQPGYRLLVNENPPNKENENQANEQETFGSDIQQKPQTRKIKLQPNVQSLLFSNELAINSSEDWNSNQPRDNQLRNHQQYRETQNNNQPLEIIEQYRQSVEVANKLDISQSHRIDQPDLGKKSKRINQQQAPIDSTHVQLNWQKDQDHVEKKTVEIRHYPHDLDLANSPSNYTNDKLQTKPNRVRQGQYNEENNIQAENKSPPTLQEKCFYDQKYIHSTSCHEFQIQAKSIDNFCDRLLQILQLVPRFVCVDLWQILGRLTPLASMLEADYRMRVDQECYLFKQKLKSINEAISKVLNHFHNFSETNELSKKMSYLQLSEKITGDAIQWIVDNASRSNLQSNIQIQNKIERLMLWAEEGSVKSTVENRSSEQPCKDLPFQTAYFKNSKQSNVDIYDPDNLQRENKQFGNNNQQMDRMNKTSNQYQDVIANTPLESMKQHQPRDPQINQPYTGHRLNDYGFQKKPMEVKKQTQQRNKTKNQMYPNPYSQRLDQFDGEKSQTDKAQTTCQQEKCVYYNQLKKYHHSSACDEFQIQAKGMDSFCQRLKDLLCSFSEFLCLDLGQVIIGLKSLARRLEYEYGSRVDQGCFSYKSKLKLMKDTIITFQGSFPKVSKFDEPSKQMTYKQMLEKVTEDVIQWIIINAQRSNLQSNTQFQLRIERLMLWNEGSSTQPIADQKTEQNPLVKAKTDIPLTKALTTNSNQSNPDINDLSNNIFRQTNPLDDRCNLKEDIHFCMLTEHYQTCKILQRIYEILQGYQTIQEYPKDSLIELTIIYQSTLGSVLKELERYQRTEIEFRSCYRNLFRTLNDHKRNLDKLLDLSKFNPFHLDTRLPNWRTEPIYFHKFIIGLLNLLKGKSQFDRSHAPTQRTITLLIQLQNLLGHTDPKVRIIDTTKIWEEQEFFIMFKDWTEATMQTENQRPAIMSLLTDLDSHYTKKSQKHLLSIERLTQPVADYKTEQNHLVKAKTDFPLTNALSKNTNQSNADINDASNNISRETRPLDDRCNSKDEIHFCMLAEQYQTCQILQCIHLTLEGYQKIQAFPKDQFIELACIYKQTLTPILEEMETYQRTDIELRSCYRKLFRSLNELKRDLDKLLEWSRLKPQNLDILLSDWRADPIYFHKFIIRLLNLLRGMPMFDAKRGPIQGEVICLIQIYNLLGHTKPNITIAHQIDSKDAVAFFEILEKWNKSTTQSVNQSSQILNLLKEIDPHLSNKPLQSEYKQPVESEMFSQRQKSISLYQVMSQNNEKQ